MLKLLYCFVFSISCINVIAQQKEKRTILYKEIAIERVMPAGWGDSIHATIKIIGEYGVEKIIKTLVVTNENIKVNISDLAPGKYSLKIIVKDSRDSIKEQHTEFVKTANCEMVELKFIPACEWIPPPPHTIHSGRGAMVDKPVIYLYPERTEEINVKVNFSGTLVKTIPEYKNGWTVSAQPDGSLTNSVDNNIYPYLFWEGEAFDYHWNMSSGFIVSADSARAFLDSVLPKAGLDKAEYTEFIDYWLPRIQKNPYSLISFAGKEYEDMAGLEINPRPDAVLRVFMLVKPAKKTDSIRPQYFTPFRRKGFTVIEWGGMELPEGL